MKMMRVAATAAVWVGVVGLGWGQTAAPEAAKRAMTFADLMAMKRVSDPQVSPSGKWVMFSVTDVSLEKNTKVNHLWVVGLDGSGTGEVSNPTIGAGQPAPIMGHPVSAGERQVTFGDGESFGRFSPNGKWVSYSAKDQIYVAAWDEAAGTVGEAKQLTRVEGGADGAVWSPDSRKLMFVASVWPECSVRGGGGTPTDRAQEDSLIEGAGGPAFVVGGTRDVGWWKDAQPATWVVEDACDKAKDDATDKSAVKGQVWEGLLYRHWDHYTGAKRSHVLVVSAMDGNEVRDLTPANEVGDAETPTWTLGGPLGYAWAPDSQEIAYVTNLDAVPAASTNNDVFTLRLDEAGAKAVKVSTSPGSDDEPEYSPDGKWLAWRSQARGGFESDKFDLIVMERKSGTIKNLTTKFDSWVDSFTWTPDSKDMVFTFPVAGAEHISGVGPESTGFSGGQVIGYEGELGDLTFAPNSNIMVGTQMRVSRATELFVYDPQHLDPATSSKNEWAGERPLTHLNDALFDQLDLAKLEPFGFAGAEGTKVEGFLIKPPGFDPAKKYPVKFLMHGGPQTAWGDAWSYRWNWELMAASGYVVIGINRRGSTGYGQKFVDEVSGDWGGRAYVDLMKGLDYAEAHYSFIDKTRECALGASYGGFMADWVLTHTNRFQCIVTHDGMYDPVAAYGSTEEMWFNEWEFRRPEDFPKGWDGFEGGYDPMGHGPGKTNTGVLHSVQDDSRGGSGRSVQDDGGSGAGKPAQPWRYAGLPADQDPFRRWAPVRFIQNAKTPTLVIHSQKDYRLDVSQGFELFTALQRLGVPSKFLYFPDEGHWVLKPQDSEVWNEVVGDWCDRWTKSGKYAER